MAVASIRVVPAVLQRAGSDTIIPAIRFVDPDVKDQAGAEFFSVSVEHLEGLLAGIHRAAADASARAEQLRTASPEDLALLKTPSGGQA